MSEDNNLFENSSLDISDEAAAKETDTTAEEIAEETEEAAEDNAYEYAAEEEETEDDGSGEDEPAEPELKASKKTNIVLISIITILVALVIIIAIVIVKNTKKEDSSSDTGTKTENTEKKDTAKEEKKTDDAKGDTAADETEGDGTEEAIEFSPDNYNVTVKLGQYKGLEVERMDTTVTDEEVEAELEAFIEDEGDYIEITDRGIEEGDLVNIDFVGEDAEGVQFAGGTSTDYDLEIGSGSFIEGFESGLIGAMPGDEVVLELTFPDPYRNNESLSGQNVKFTVTVNSISRWNNAALTDEFFAENTDYATVDEYREYIREELEEDAEYEADQGVISDLLEMAIDNAEFGGDIDKEIADYTDYMIGYNETMYNYYYGVDPITYYGWYGVDEEGYYQLVEDNAEYQVKYALIVEEIFKAEGLTISEEEYNEKFETIFINYYGYQSKEDVLASIDQKSVDEIVEQSVWQETVEKILKDNAVITQEKVEE